MYLTEKGGGPGAPNWIYFTYVTSCWPIEDLMVGLTLNVLNRWAAGLFMYQSLDAIDGLVCIIGWKKIGLKLMDVLQ